MNEGSKRNPPRVGRGAGPGRAVGFVRALALGIGIALAAVPAAAQMAGFDAAAFLPRLAAGITTDDDPLAAAGAIRLRAGYVDLTGYRDAGGNAALLRAGYAEAIFGGRPLSLAVWTSGRAFDYRWSFPFFALDARSSGRTIGIGVGLYGRFALRAWYVDQRLYAAASLAGSPAAGTRLKLELGALGAASGSLGFGFPFPSVAWGTELWGARITADAEKAAWKTELNASVGASPASGPTASDARFFAAWPWAGAAAAALSYSGAVVGFRLEAAAGAARIAPVPAAAAYLSDIDLLPRYAAGRLEIGLFDAFALSAHWLDASVNDGEAWFTGGAYLPFIGNSLLGNNRISWSGLAFSGVGLAARVRWSSAAFALTGEAGADRWFPSGAAAIDRLLAAAGPEAGSTPSFRRQADYSAAGLIDADLRFRIAAAVRLGPDCTLGFQTLQLLPFILPSEDRPAAELPSLGDLVERAADAPSSGFALSAWLDWSL
jgi:hypothetical protein